MTEFMERHGFTVTRHYAGLDTAWRAVFDNSHRANEGRYRVIGVNSEMDALPGIGNACGHNLIGVCGMGIAVALKDVMIGHDFPGKIIALGTPAEEFGGGKIILLERGAYEEMDICVMAHPGNGPPNISVDGSMSAAQIVFAEFEGRPVHAAQAPWEGINAMDAAVIAYNGISSLRQQLRPDLRVHGFISGHELSANTIPDNAQMTYVVRGPTRDLLYETMERVENCFRAGALATGCKVNIRKELPYYDLRNNRVLAREFAEVTAKRYGMIVDHMDVAASTDFVRSLQLPCIIYILIELVYYQGNVTYALPGFHPLYTITSDLTASPHTPGFEHSAGTIEGQRATTQVAKGLAITALRIIYDTPFYEEIKAAFEEDMQMAKIAKKLAEV
ncbi:hypothetical protein H0H92_006509 [Tricholoma furcatifolium]|nr:hypothetical protein H0H92_006509 [Tricholoma furcatifolium]